MLLSVLVSIYLLIKVLIFYTRSLSVIEFAFLTMTFGLAPAYSLKRVLKFDNIIGWLVNSSVLGILFIPFLFLALGWMGVNFVFIYSTCFLYACSLMGMISLLFFADDLSVEYYFISNAITKTDALFYITIIGYTFILTLLNFSRVYIQWDAFTFWGLDAKYIFHLNQLRDSTLDVFGSFRYTAYYPVYYSIIYDLYGVVAEQYANWINVFLNLLALLLIYNNILQKGVVHKLLIVTMLIIVSYAATLVVNMFSMYADILCAFNLLLFVIVLISNYKFESETYSKRMFLLLLLAASFYFIKSPFIFLTCLLMVVYIVYDLKFLLNNLWVLMKRADFWLIITLIVVMYMMRFNYFTTILKTGSNTPITDLYLPNFSSLYDSLSYAIKLTSWLIDKSPYLVGMWFLGICSVFLVEKQGSNKGYYFIYWISITVVLSYCIVYLINQSDLSSNSLARYCAVIMYLVPLMFSYIGINLSPTKCIVVMTVLFLLLGYFFIKTMTPMPLYEKFTLSTGSYNVVLKKESRIAEETLRISGDSSRILIADDFSNNNLLSNMYIDAIFVRYFLMFNSVGGQYIMTTEKIYEYSLSQNADYVLLLSYANTFEHCEKIFIEDHNYLIKTDRHISYSVDECIFSKNVILDLTKK